MAKCKASMGSAVKGLNFNCWCMCVCHHPVSCTLLTPKNYTMSILY